MISLPLLTSAALAGTPQPLPGVLPQSTHARHLERLGAPGAPPPAAPTLPPPAASGPDVTVYGYHAWWSGSPLDVDFTRLTHLAVFNVDLNSDGTLDGEDNWTDYAAELVPLAHSHGVKVHLCLTSFYDDTTNAVLGSASRRATTIAALKTLVDDYGADGVNVDIEGLDYSQKENLVSFVTELNAAVDEVFIATPAIDWLGAFDYDELAANSDGLFIMGYGYHWSGGDPGPIAPLYGGGIWSDYSLEWTVSDYLNNGTPADKIILGLPLYGREWPTDGPDIPGTATDEGEAVLMSSAVARAASSGSDWDDTTHTPYILESSSQLWYDDTDSVRDRVAYAVDAGLQGIGFWALGYEGGSSEFWQMISEETDLGADGGGSDTGGGGGEDGQTPIALAGLPLMAYPGDTILLNGTPSYDPGGATLTYSWSQVAGPAIALSGAGTAEPQFTAEEAGVHTFSLIVSTATASSLPDTVDIIVVDPGAGKRYASGCSATAAGGGLLLPLLGLAFRRKRA